MKINKNVMSSSSLKIAKFLFVDDDRNIFPSSLIIRFISKFDNFTVSFFSLVAAISCFWYKTIFIYIGASWVNDYKLWVIFIFVSLLFCEKRYLVSSRSIIYLMLFLGSVLLSGLIASINGLSLAMLLTGVISISPFLLAFIIASTYKRKNLVIDMLIILSVPLLASGLIQWATGIETTSLWVSSSEYLVKTRVFGFLENPNALGGLSMITTIIGLSAFLERRKWLHALYSILSASVLILTFSRGAWLGFAVGIIAVVMIKNWRFIVALPLILLGLISSEIRQRVMIILNSEYMTDASIDGRTWSVNNMVELFKTSPFIGVGPGSYGTQGAISYNSPIYLNGLQNGYLPFNSTDSQWFQLLCQLGVFGVLSLIMFFTSHFINNLIAYLRSNSYLSLGVMASIIALVINGFFENVLSFGVIAILAGIYIGLGVNYE